MVRSDQVPVRLGTLLEGGLAPAILAVVERGVRLRPELVRELNAEVELASEGMYPPVRIVFRGSDGVLVEDGPARAADLRVDGPLPDVVALLVTPLLGGVPSPIDRRGRTAVGRLAGGRVKVGGRIGLMRRFLSLIRI